MILGITKRAIQREIFQDVKGTILGLAGPRPAEYLKVVGTNVILYENDPSLYKRVKPRIKVPYIYGDIQYAQPTEAIDLDLMRTGQVERDRILHLFKKQIETFSEALFVYTICSRNNKNDLIKEISKIIKGFGANGNITIYRYKEGAPMKTIKVWYTKMKRLQ